MVKLNDDVLFQIFKVLQYDINSLFSCLLVNKSWCRVAVPILWRNPWKNVNKAKAISRFNVIISHFSNDVQDNLRNNGIILLKTQQQRPLFNYIRFIRHLELNELRTIYIPKKDVNYKIFAITIITEIFKLFINSNTRFINVYIPVQFSYPIHLLPGAEFCFSELQYLYCSLDNTNQNVLEGFAGLSKSIKNLRFESVDASSKIVKLIENQSKLIDVDLTCDDKSTHQDIEESLIKHSNTIEYLQITWEPVTNFLSNFVNLISLELFGDYTTYTTRDKNWSNIEDIILPSLQILKVRYVPPKSFTKLIENSKKHLTKISTNYDEEYIRAIYQNCPKLKYLKLTLDNNNFQGLKELLNKCQVLNGLVFEVEEIYGEDIDWSTLFEILIESSPVSLFKFKISTLDSEPNFESFNLFFANWKNRKPMILKTIQFNSIEKKLIERYKSEGTIQYYENNLTDLEDFEWI